MNAATPLGARGRSVISLVFTGHSDDTSTAVHPRAPSDDTSTAVQLETDGNGTVRVTVSASVVARAWIVRLHLRPGQRVATLQYEAKGSLAAQTAEALEVQHLQPHPDCAGRGFFPFGGAGTAPACKAGPVAEFRLVAGNNARSATATLAAVI